MAPSLKGKVESSLPGTSRLLTKVIDGVDEATVAKAMTVGVKAACMVQAS